MFGIEKFTHAQTPSGERVPELPLGADVAVTAETLCSVIPELYKIYNLASVDGSLRPYVEQMIGFNESLSDVALIEQTNELLAQRDSAGEFPTAHAGDLEISLVAVVTTLYRRLGGAGGWQLK